MHRASWWLIAGCSLAGCTSTEVLVAHSVPLVPVAQEVPETELLDVSVGIFDAGVPEGVIEPKVLEELVRDGTFVQIRRAEALYMAVVLRDTLRRSGQWGTVWIAPDATTAADLNVAAKIVHSDGNIFQLHVTATDATGREWLSEDYEMSTAAGAFNRQRYPNLDPYQDVFNEVANDLAMVFSKLSAKDRRDIRTVASMRYASELSPEAFTGYVAENKGRYVLNRLPADGDPMFDRTQRVRQRERLFLETLDQHYEKFYRDASESYNGWREYAREEAIEIQELTKSARWRTGMGVATILASVVYGSNSNNDAFSDRVIRDALMYIGMDMIKTSSVRRQEKKLHTDSLEELSASFDDSIEPMVVEVQGTQHRLSGTAELQYAEWRDLLKQIFVSESGFVPEEVAIYTEPEPENIVPVQTDSLTPPEAAPAQGAVPATDGTQPPAVEPAQEPAGGAEESASEPASDAVASFRSGA